MRFFKPLPAKASGFALTLLPWGPGTGGFYTAQKLRLLNVML